MCNDYESNQTNLYLRKQWEWVAGKPKYCLQYCNIDGKPKDGFSIVIRGPDYCGRGWEVLVCGERYIVKAGIALNRPSAMSWGEALYRLHYGI